MKWNTPRGKWVILFVGALSVTVNGIALMLGLFRNLHEASGVDAVRDLPAQGPYHVVAITDDEGTPMPCGCGPYNDRIGILTARYHWFHPILYDNQERQNGSLLGFPMVERDLSEENPGLSTSGKQVGRMGVYVDE